MKCTNKQFIRKILGSKLNSILIVLLIGLGVACFAMLQSLTQEYSNHVERYFLDNNYMDVLVRVTNISEKDLEEIKRIDGIKECYSRMVVNGELNNSTSVCIIIGENHDINCRYVYETVGGGDSVCAINKKSADALGISCGEIISLYYKGVQKEFIVNELCASPEYVYLSQNIYIPIANPNEFAVVWMEPDAVSGFIDIENNQIAIDVTDDADLDKIVFEIKDQLGLDCLQIRKRAELINYELYEDDIEQISSFSLIVPVFFLVVCSLVMYVLLKRIVEIDRRQIGIMKAIGVPEYEIVSIFYKYVLFLIVIGGVLAIVISRLSGKYIMDIFGEMFEVPLLAYSFHYKYFFIGMAVLWIVSTFVSLSTLKVILGIDPAVAMKEEAPQPGKRIMLEGFKVLWNAISVNTRYTLKTSMRNKVRFFAVVIGMVSTCALTVFSLGFGDSFRYIANEYYDSLLNYDIRVETALEFFDKDVIDIECLMKEKAFIAPCVLTKSGIEVDTNLMAIDGTDMKAYNINIDGINSFLDGEGIILPKPIVDTLGVSIMDVVSLHQKDYDYKRDFIVVGVSDQIAEMYAIVQMETVGDMFLGRLEKQIDSLSEQEKELAKTIHDYGIDENDITQELVIKNNELNDTIDKLNDEISNGIKMYNTLFLSVEDVSSIIQKISEDGNVWSVITMEESKKSLNNVLGTVSVLVAIILVFAFFLGVVVLLAVSVINISARQYEFATLKVLGYSPGCILLTYIKETIMELVFAMPFGTLIGVLSLHLIKSKFSTDIYSMIVIVEKETIGFMVALLFVVFFIMSIFVYYKIRKIDLVVALKAKE